MYGLLPLFTSVLNIFGGHLSNSNSIIAILLSCLGPNVPQHDKYSGKPERRHKRGEPTGPCSIENFVPACWANFKFDVDAIMACL